MVGRELVLLYLSILYIVWVYIDAGGVFFCSWEGWTEYKCHINNGLVQTSMLWKEGFKNNNQQKTLKSGIKLTSITYENKLAQMM